MAEADCCTFDLSPDLRLRVLSLLPPNDLALGGRLSCKGAAQRFSEPHHRTARLSQPLTGHVVTATPARGGEGATEGSEGSGGTPVEHASRAITQLNFRQKLRLATTAAASGCDANVEFALQLLQPHVFPELLQTAHYLGLMQEGQPRQRQGELPPSPATHVGSAVVASGLAHLLPSLAQRCPGLLDPGATLEAAAWHLSLAGLQAAWQAVGDQLTSRLQLPRRQPGFGPALDFGFMAQGISMGQGFSLAQLRNMALSASEACKVWRRVMVAAACSPAGDSTAKLEWALDKSRVDGYTPSLLSTGDLWGAAAASGDLARLRWLREHGFPWGGAVALAAVLRHADLACILGMDSEGSYLPPVGDPSWRSAGLAPAAAASPRDSAAKLSWLAGRGVEVGTEETVRMATRHGNLAALQLALQECAQQQQQQQQEAHEEVGGMAVPLSEAMVCAVQSGHVPTAAWLHQAGCELHSDLLWEALDPGHLPMLRWLLESGCPTGGVTLANVADLWPSHTPADGERLLEALQLLANAGMRARSWGEIHPLVAAGHRGHPWGVWHCLEELAPPFTLPEYFRGQLVKGIVSAGNEVIVGAVAQLGWLSGADTTPCYAAAAQNGDRGTLACLHRLGVPMGDGVLAAAVKSSAPLPALRWLVGHGASTQSAVAPGTLGSLRSYYLRDQERAEVQAWLQGLS